MNFEQEKEKFITLKMEELEYINHIFESSANCESSEFDKIQIYRELKKYEEKLNMAIENLLNALREDETFENLHSIDTIIQFDINKKWFLSSNERDRQYLLWAFHIDNYKYALILEDLLCGCNRYKRFAFEQFDFILRRLNLIQTPIYIFERFAVDDYDNPFLPLAKQNLNEYAIYSNLFDILNINAHEISILKTEMTDFEDNNYVINKGEHLKSYEIRKIFESELLNTENFSIDDCVKKTKVRVSKLNYERSPEYKKKVLMERVNKLYSKVKETKIGQDILFSGNSFDVLRETYQLPSGATIENEKVIRNNARNSIMIVPITNKEKYIITFQNILFNQGIAEFPSGCFEVGEDVIEAAKRILLEKTGYVSDDLFIIDQVHSASEFDNSITYIVIANRCFREANANQNGKEILVFDLFNDFELQNLIESNILNGTMNKLAYYNLIYNYMYDVEVKGCQKVWKRKREITPLH